MTRHRVGFSAAFAGAFLLLLSSCGGGDDRSVGVEVAGHTGTCTQTSQTWSGEPLLDGLTQGTQLERELTCDNRTVNDPRVEGNSTITMSCKFNAYSETAVAVCSGVYTTKNENGTWTDQDSKLTITAQAGAPTTIVADGVQVGSGEYDGLEFAFHIEGVEDVYPWALTGTIQSVKP